MRSTDVGFLVSALLASACGPVIQTVTLDPGTGELRGTPLDGIVFYEPALFRVTYSFGVRIDDNGNVLGTEGATDSTKKCIPVPQKDELQILPDFSTPRALLFHNRPFSATKFSATLSNGMLTAVGAETTPQGPELLKAIIEAAGGAIKPAMPGLGMACNASLYISNLRRVTLPAPDNQ